MKKIKKLLPIASVAGLTAIVTPLVTSCGVGGITIDGTELYIPKAEKAVADEEHAEGYEISDATKLYHDDLEKNENIFKEDIYFSISEQLMTMVSEAKIFGYNLAPKVKLNVTNLKVGKLDTYNDIKFFNLSFEVKGSFDVVMYTKKRELQEENRVKPWKKSQIIDLNSFSVKAENLPYVLMYSDGVWQVMPAPMVMVNDPLDSFKIEMKAKGYMAANSGLAIYDNEKYVFDINTYDKPLTVAQETLLEVLAYTGAVTNSFHMLDIIAK